MSTFVGAHTERCLSGMVTMCFSAMLFTLNCWKTEELTMQVHISNLDECPSTVWRCLVRLTEHALITKEQVRVEVHPCCNARILKYVNAFRSLGTPLEFVDKKIVKGGREVWECCHERY